MHHIYTGGKGDPLCPLGFHPQVRWPTRCKRCFRDYKEHGGKGKDQGQGLAKEDMTRSTPSLSMWSSTSPRIREEDRSGSSIFPDFAFKAKDSAFVNGGNPSGLNSSFSSNKSLSSSTSWTSTPDLGNVSADVSTTVSVTLPRRRMTSEHSNDAEASSKSVETPVRRRYTTDLSHVNIQNGAPPSGKPKAKSSDATSTVSKPAKGSENLSNSASPGKPPLKKTLSETKKEGGKPPGKLKKPDSGGQNDSVNPDVEFILRVKSSKPEGPKKTGGIVRQTSSTLIPPRTSSSSSSSGADDSNDEDECDDDNASTVCTDTTETTLVGKTDSELLEEVESLRNELESMKARCEKVEREKSDILLRRLASLDTTSTKTAASEVLKLQQKVNELSTQSEDLKDDNKSLGLRVKELERELQEQKESNKASKRVDELQAKLAAAETLCEELMDENEDMKKELRELEDEIEEMQDNFREDQADEYSSLKKELEQTTKNCRILSFKLRKTERKAEQLEADKLEVEKKYQEIADQKGMNTLEKTRKLEKDLKVANETAARLTKELEEANKRLKSFDGKNDSEKTSPSTVGNTLKPGGEKVSRASLTRGGSQEDPQQLLRDLQDSLEREADLREQLRFAEEEAANLRKKAERVEEDNDSLAIQLKKMATKAKSGRKSSPSTSNRIPRPVTEEKDEGVSDEEDPVELKLLLELNEQEAVVLRKKVEDLESDSAAQKKRIKELKEQVSKLGETTEENHSAKRQLKKSLSLDSPTEQQALDLKRQLQMVEQEATVLRTKITTLEADNEKLSAENKKLQLLRGTKKASSSDGSVKITNLESKLADSEKQIKELKQKLEKLESADKKSSTAESEVEKLKKELKAQAEELQKLTKESSNANETLRRLREDAAVDVVEFYKARKPKKPTEFTTKIQLKKMVEDLENEIGDVLVVLKKSASQKGNEVSKSEVEEKNRKIRELEEKLNENSKVLEESGKKRSAEEKLETEKKKLEAEKKQMEETVQKLEKEKQSWKTEKKNLETQIELLNSEKKSSHLVEKEISIFAKKLEASNKLLEEERETVKKLNKQMENVKKLEGDKNEFEKEVTRKSREMSDLEKKLAESEERLRKAEKNLSISRGKVSKLEKALEESEEAKKSQEKAQKTMESELRDAKATNSSMTKKVSDLEEEIKKSKITIKDLEDTIRKERERATDEHIKAGSIEKKEITALRDDLSKKSAKLDALNEKLERVEKDKREAEEGRKKLEAELTKEKNSWQNKATELENTLSAERKLTDRLKETHEKEQKSREVELASLRSKMKILEHTAGTTSKKMSEMKDEWAEKYQKLEEELKIEKRKYSDLTTKYELLEEEHVVTKAQLVMEKEQAQNKLGVNKKEITKLEMEMKSLRESLMKKQESWMKEKKEFQEKMKSASENSVKPLQAKWELEKAKLNAVNEEQKSVAEQLKQQNESMMEQMDHMRRENEELRKKLDDFDKVSKIQRQMSADTNQLEKELREAKEKLATEKKNRKSELATLKLRYESRVNLISDELQSSQNHVSRFKRERDNYKHMLEEAQTQMAELKKGNTAEASGELRDSKTHVAVLEQQVSCLEDELSEARLECSKLKTELVSEKSAWEVKLSELQSKVNAMEEEKILSSGRTKVVGLRTKMELAWQKEREDQQRLLQETAALARDLRQTLYEVERERDKERMEAKRRQEQMKKASEEEAEENRKKVSELQYDLLELRDAHAKLRTTNEKLRREKDKWDKESRSLHKSRMKTEEDERKLQVLLDNVDLLLKASFETKYSGRFADPKKRGGSKSRETSPMTPQDDIQIILQRLSQTAEEIRSRTQMDEREEERNKRASSVGYRSLRGASTESDTSEAPGVIRRPMPLQRKNTLFRKSLSLTENVGAGAQDQKIWRDVDNEVGSLSSLDEHMSARLKGIGLRENSLDSRLSGGSTQSEMLGDKKKKKGLLGRLKKLTKNKEYQTSSQEDILRGGSDSDVSGTGDVARGSKKDLKGKLADMFKKESSSKSGSVEQLKKSDDRKCKTLPRQTSGTSPTPNPMSTPPSGRPLDKSRNPAASLLKKP